MTDVFVKLWPQHELRWLMAQLVLERLNLLAGARVFLIVPWSMRREPRVEALCSHWARLLVAPDEIFHSTSKVVAARAAASPEYVVMDDDHLPIGADWLSRGVTALRTHETFAMLASWSVNGEVDPLTVGPQGAVWSDELFESFGLGTPYFVNRLRVPPETFEIPETEAHTYDGPMSERVRRYGRLGFLRNVRHNHLGIGFSTAAPGHWRA